jgi:phosphonate transport system substrate-binding protein
MSAREAFTFALAPTLKEGRSSPAEHAESFRAYLSTALDRPVNLTMPASYQETLDALRSGHADAAMVGDYVSRQGEAIGGIEQLVAPVSPDQQAQTYRSVVVTRIDSGLRDIPMLRGATLGLVDGQSTSGYLVPRAMLREAGIYPDRDLTIRLFPSHRDVVEAIISADIDAGAFHENRLHPPTLDRGADYARLRVLTTSRPIPNGPLVVRTNLDTATRTRLSDAMLRIHEADPQAAAVMLRQGHRFTLAATRSNPTLKSIAALAGVSYATVSRFINKSGYVAPETAERIGAIVDELGYAPNGHARVLLGHQSPVVGLVVSLQSTRDLDELIHLVEPLRIELEQHQIPLVLCPIGEHLEGSPFAGMIRDKRLGALILGPDHANDPRILALARTGHPIVAIDPTNPTRLVPDILTAIGIAIPA